MALTTPTRPAATPALRSASMARPGPPGPSGLASLEAGSHTPEVQAIIRDAIHRGTLRVRPIPGNPGRVKLLRVPPVERTGPGR